MWEQIRNKLMSELSYSYSCASRTAKDLCRLKSADLREGLLDWLRDGTETVIKDGAFSTVRLMEEHHMTYPAALIFLDWYRESPESAASALRMRM